MTNTEPNVWKKCSTCKKPIHFRQKYYICSVSTCSGQRTGYVFCSIQCFETHLPGAKHRDAGAIEKTAPSVMISTPPASSLNSSASSVSASSPQSSSGSKPSNSGHEAEKEILIVASKLKEYIRAKSEMNTSASVMDILSEMVRIACDRAIESARSDGRKTVLDRDFKFKV